MILAIDFDATIVDSRYPNIIGLRKDAKKYINRMYDDGHYIIIWTCRTGGDLRMATQFLDDNGVKYHIANDNNPVETARWNNNSRKVFADLYIDDKQIGGLPSWKTIYKHVKQQSTK